MTAPAGRFGTTKTAPQVKSGAWFKEGSYIVETRLLKYEMSKNVKKKGIANFVHEAIVVESSNPDVKPGAKRTHILQRKPGIAWDDLEPKFQASEGDINNLVSSVLQAMGVTKAQLDAMSIEDYDKAIESLVGPENPAGKASARLKLVVTNIAVGTAGGVFSKHEYEPAPQVKAA